MKVHRADPARIATLIRDARMCEEAARRRAVSKHGPAVNEFARQAAAYLRAQAEKMDPKRTHPAWRES